MISFGKYGDPEERAGDQCCIQDRRLLGNLGELSCMYTSLRVEFVVSSFPCFESLSLGTLVLSYPQKLTCPNSNSIGNKVTLRAEATFSLCELACKK